MLFSATMPEEIVRLANRYMRNPVRIIAQKHISRDLLEHVYYDVKKD